MRLVDNPFSKYSYRDEKTWRNRLEVAVSFVAACQLEISAGIVNAICHNYYLKLDVPPEQLGRAQGRVRLAVKKMRKIPRLARKLARDLAYY